MKSRPRIVIDARMIGMGGIGRYTESLVRAMMRKRPEIRWTLVGDPSKLGGLAGAEIRTCRAPIYSASEAWGMKNCFKDADLVHIPHFNAPFFCPRPLVVTVHDLIHFDYPEYQPFWGANRVLDWKLRRLLKRANAVLTVSEATAAALKERYALAGLEKKLHAIWEGAEAIFSSVPQADDRERLGRLGVAEDGLLVLYVGAIREHKDVHVLANAFAALREEHPNLPVRLILAGKLDPRFDRKRKFLSDIARRPGVVHLTGKTDEDLAALYRRAAVVVLPSRAEGFGLPAAEAMRSGAPVIVSDIPVLKEIAGSAAKTFPVGQMDDLKNLLYNILTNAPLRSELSKKSLHRGALFEWSSTAAGVLQVYDTVLQS